MNLTQQPVYAKGQKRIRRKTPAELEDEAYLEWVRTQPSCISGKGPCEAAHVRRLKYGSGTADKGKMNAVPLTPEEHRDQHHGGEAYCLNKHRPKVPLWTETEAKQWFEDQRDEHLTRWRGNMEEIRGDVLTKAEMQQRGITVTEGKRGGVEFRALNGPVDFYYRRGLLPDHEYRAAERFYKDFYKSGQMFSGTCDPNAVRSNEQRAYLPVTDMQREALDNWRRALEAVNGIGKNMVIDVCCYGYWVKDHSYAPFDNRGAMLRFREALSELADHYKKS